MGSINNNGHALPDTTAPSDDPKSHLNTSGPVWDFLTATRDAHAFRFIRDKFKDFDLATVPDANGAALLIWKQRVNLDAKAVQEGTPLDELVSKHLEWAKTQPDARDALAWLEDKDAEVIKMPSDAPKVARRLVEQWQRVPRFTFKTLKALEAEPDPEWLIHGFLTEGGTSLLTATHGSYKSFFALEMALCIACGFPFHGHEVKAGRVVYIAAEGASGIKKRARAWLRHHGQDAGENFIVLDAPLRIHEDGTRAAFIEAIADLRPLLVVFDTLARCAVGLEENSAGDMGRWADALGELSRATGANALTVHHNNRNGAERGSSAIAAAVDTHIALSKGEGKCAPVTLSMPKQKDFEALYPITFEPREVAFLHKGKAVSSLIFEKAENLTGPNANETERDVLAALGDVATEAGVSSSVWKEASEARGVPKSTFHKVQKRLIQPVSEGGLGLVCVVHGEHGKPGARFGLTVSDGLRDHETAFDSPQQSNGLTVSHTFRGETVRPEGVSEVETETETEEEEAFEA